jgi:hypothetical protein
MLDLVIELACFVTCLKPSESKAVFNVYRFSMKRCLFLPLSLQPHRVDVGNTKNYYGKDIGRDNFVENNVLDMWKEALQQITPEIIVAILVYHKE